MHDPLQGLLYGYLLIGFGLIVGWLDCWMVGWLDCWIVGWLDGWIVGLLDGWMVGLLMEALN